MPRSGGGVHSDARLLKQTDPPVEVGDQLIDFVDLLEGAVPVVVMIVPLVVELLYLPPLLLDPGVILEVVHRFLVVVGELPGVIDAYRVQQLDIALGLGLVIGAALLRQFSEPGPIELHGIGGDECPIAANDALAKEVGDDKVDMVLANPPFGKKSSITVINEKTGKKEQEKLVYEREDFWATTSNKQLNFVQHIANMLKIDGKAAVVVPDNVLFEGGAGETVRKNLLERCDLHTLLRLPTGIFYAQGVKANVIFFDAKPASKTAWTKKLWVYDYRTNVHKTLKQNRLNINDFQEFIECYKPEDRSKRRDSEKIERWKSFTHDDLIARDKTNLDIFWLKDDALEDTENLPAPEVLATEIVEQLEAALEEFRSVEEILNSNQEASTSA